MVVGELQNKNLKGPAKNLQRNSHFPAGIAPGSVKKNISVKNSHSEEEGMPRHPQPLADDLPCPCQNQANRSIPLKKAELKCLQH